MGNHDEAKAQFEAWFRERYRPALSVARRIVGDGAAEDVTAEAFARAYLRWGRLRRLDHRDAWLFRVVANVAVDDLRRRRSMPERGVLVDPSDDDVTARVVLVAALSRLPRRQREAVVLRHLAGLTNAEVATYMDISAESVKEHVARGLAKLRDRLGATWKEPDLACD